MRVAGVMSGTSLDGIDVAIVDITGRAWNARIETVATSTRPYPKRVREAILGVSNASTHTAAISRLNFLLGELYAEAVIDTCRDAGLPLESLELIGCHGQTIFHEGQETKYLGRTVASTLQIGEAAVVAERTGVAVIADFRVRDMAAGGKGAPLVPYVDYSLYRDARRGRVSLNIGGIANVTAIPPKGKPEDVIAFDTGPGNMVIDALVARHTRGRQTFDRDGRIAAKGRVNEGLLDRLLHGRFFRQNPPKTAGREEYGASFLEHFEDMTAEDAIATATALTPSAIAMGIDLFVRPAMRVDDLIVSGGGVHNPRIMAYLAGFLPGVNVLASDDFGIDSDAKEAIAFAVLAYESRHSRPGNLPSATGARRSVVLGKYTQGQRSWRR